MSGSLELQKFCRSEFEREAALGFHTLRRVPNSHVSAFIEYFSKLSDDEKNKHAEAASTWAAMRIGPEGMELHSTLLRNEAWRRWSDWGTWNRRRFPSIERLRDSNRLAAQDRAHGVNREVSQQIKDITASAVRAPELRKRISSSFSDSFGAKVVNRGGGWWIYECVISGSPISVDINYGGRSYQLEYEVRIELSDPPRKLSKLAFETVMGITCGTSWDFIVQENVDDAIRLFSELVTYAAELPSRLPAGCFAASTV